MKGGTLQVIWHDSLPVLSLDFHIDTKLLATAGADHDIKVKTSRDFRAAYSLPDVVQFSADILAMRHLFFSDLLRIVPLQLWAVAQKDDEKGSPFVVFKANLSFHTTAVNVIRFSPSGAPPNLELIRRRCLPFNGMAG